MDVKAKVKYIRMSPRKVRLVIDVIRNKPINRALDELTMVNKRAVQPVRKLLHSALANAENNFKLKPEDLFIKSIVADEGPVLKRWRARAFGRAAMIRKPTTHISVILSDGKEEPVEKIAESKKEKPELKDKADKPARAEKTKSEDKKTDKKSDKKKKKTEPNTKATDKTKRAQNTEDKKKSKPKSKSSTK